MVNPHFHIYYILDRSDPEWCNCFAEALAQKGLKVTTHTPYDSPIENEVSEDGGQSEGQRILVFVLTNYSWSNSNFKKLLESVIASHDSNHEKVVGVFHGLVGVGLPISEYQLINVVQENCTRASEIVLFQLGLIEPLQNGR